MSEDRHFITADGLKKVERDLHQLRTVRRPRVAERLHNALTERTGELGEDAEYEDAKNEQAFVEGEIARLEDILRRAQIIDEDAPKDTVQIGSRVTLREKGTREDEVYHIVGEAEADPSEGRISYKSPMGEALMGSKKKQEVDVQAPDGVLTFVVRSID